MADIKMNMSTFDRFARIIGGGILLMLATYVPLNPFLSWFVVVFGLVLMLEGLAGWAPLYALLKISTKK